MTVEEADSATSKEIVRNMLKEALRYIELEEPEHADYTIRTALIWLEGCK